MLPDDDVVVGEVEADPIEAPNPIADFLNSVESQDFVSAEKQFNDMVGDRLQNAMDQAKVKIASSMYMDADESDDEPEVETSEVEVEDELEDEVEMELTDDELDAWEDDAAAV